jgi:LDH2 family malate/lactate/ureidoglycolate dehydrogenase
MAADCRISEQDLGALVRACFEGLGIGPADAAAVADALVYADLRARPAHGVHRVPAYMTRVRLGLVGGTEHMRQLASSRAVVRLDAAHALGPAAAVRGTDLAVELARRHGVGLVAVGRSTHMGAAGFYARRAARESMIAFVLSNGPSAVAPFGGAEAFAGTNPLAVGLPLGGGELVLDMSTSGASREHVRRVAASGRVLDPGVALDAAGAPTTDPNAALSGSLLPAGGRKGSGLGLVIGLLAVMLAGADFDDEVGMMHVDLDRPQNVGQVFIAVDPAAAGGEGGADRARQALERLHALRPAQGHDRVLYPGERGDEEARRRQASGIPVAVGTLERLAAACEECGLHEVAARALAARGAGA